MSSEPHDPAYPATVEAEARETAMLAHLSALVGFIFPFGNVLGPLAILLWKGERSSFVADQAKEALNFQISMTLYGFLLGIILAVLWIVGLFGLLLRPDPSVAAFFLLTVPLMLVYAALFIFDLVLIILAAVRANSGVRYRYPLTLRILD